MTYRSWGKLSNLSALRIRSKLPRNQPSERFGCERDFQDFSDGLSHYGQLCVVLVHGIAKLALLNTDASIARKRHLFAWQTNSNEQCEGIDALAEFLEADFSSGRSGVFLPFAGPDRDGE